jgi:hypothetical protein
MLFHREQQLREANPEIGTVYSSCIKEEISEDDSQKISYEHLQSNTRLQAFTLERKNNQNEEQNQKEFLTAENSQRKLNNNRSLRSSIS